MADSGSGRSPVGGSIVGSIGGAVGDSRMRGSRITWLGIAMAVVTLCAGCDSGTNHVADWSKVDQTLNGFVTSNLIAGQDEVQGYSFAVTGVDGTLYETAGGDQTVDTVSPIASATKVPSSIAILTLVDAGKLNLDEPVKTYLNQFDPSFDWPLDKRTITMRMLLSHTAGIPSPPDPQTSDCLSSTVTTLRACAQQIAQAPLDYQPGTTFSYSGADYQVAGYVAQLIAQEPFATLFADAVAQPLKLNTFIYDDPQNPRVAGGGSCNVDDYAKIMRMILRDGVADDGTRVLSDAMIQELEKNQISGTTIETLPFLQDSAPYFAPEYTLGFFVTNPAEYQQDGSPGPEFVDPGLFGTTPWIDTGLGYGAIIMITSDTQTGLDMWNAARPVVISQLR
jgi:CubicO group peptidase (beta-lactamase class C family)